VGDTETAPDGKGRYSRFQGGSIYYTAATGPHEVCGSIRTKWLAKGGPTGFLGYPITGQRNAIEGGHYNDFQHGSVYWRSDLGAHEVHGPIFSRWEFIGRERSILGYPTADQQPSTDGVGAYSTFRGGSIYWSPSTGPHEVCGSIRDKWTLKGRETGFLGYPVTGQRTLPDGVGRYNDFVGGSIYWGPSTGAYELHGPIRTKWLSLGGVRSSVGYPISDIVDLGGGLQRATFQAGTLTYDPGTGVVTVTP